MTFLDHLRTYYAGERSGALLLGIVGVPLLAIAMLVWRTSLPASVGRGLAIPLLLFGLFSVSVGFPLAYAGQKRLEENSRQYMEHREEFLAREIPHMEGVRARWLYVRIVWTLIAASGIVTIFAARKGTWLGVGAGLLLLGAIGHLLEAVSYERNERYTTEVLELKR